MFTTSPQQQQNSQSSIGNRIPAELWSKLLAQMTMIDCFHLETVCRVFAESIYAAQKRFKWDKKFVDRIYKKYYITLTPKSIEELLDVVSIKIGPHCQQLILKVYKMPSNHRQVLPHFTRLRSLYLQVQVEDEFWTGFFEQPNDLPLGTLRELRFVMGKSRTENYLPAKLFPDFMTRCASTLESFQANRCETQPGCERAMYRLPRLRKFRLTCDEDRLGFFQEFARIYRLILKRLYVTWIARAIDDRLLIQFGRAIAQFGALETLSIEIDWLMFRDAAAPPVTVPVPLARTPPKLTPEAERFRRTWISFCSALSIQDLRKFSIEIKHTNFQSTVRSAEIVDGLCGGCRQLSLLRIIADEHDVFPLTIAAGSVHTLEIVFKYAKIYRDLWSTFSRDEMGEYMRVNIVPYYRNQHTFVIERFDRGNLVRALKLVHCPLLDAYLFSHISYHFYLLEMFSFRALTKEIYRAEVVSIDVAQNLCEFFRQLPSLRVIRFVDTFRKPDLSSLLFEFIERARRFPERAFVLYCDRRKHLRDRTMLAESLSLKNLRIY